VTDALIRTVCLDVKKLSKSYVPSQREMDALKACVR
jgi:hypothetical protein